MRTCCAPVALSQQTRGTMTNRIILPTGEPITLAEAAQRANTSEASIVRRLKLGCPPAQLLVRSEEPGTAPPTSWD